MNPVVRQTRSHLMSLFERQGIHPRSDLGQNFLIDMNLLDFIVAQAELGPEDVVLEVGAGTGGLTACLAPAAGHVISVEIDDRVSGLARAATAACSNVTMLFTDALQSKHRFAAEVLDEIALRLAEVPGRRLKLVANLPYCIATPVISNLVASELPWTLMVVTIQWELAERMRASPGVDDYSALSVWLQSQCRLRVLRKLGPKVFWPRPQVDSAIVRLEPDPAGRAALGDRVFFQEFLRRLFTQRRKALRGVLAAMYPDQLDRSAIDAFLDSLQLPRGVRAEQVDVSTLVRLADVVRPAVAAVTAPERFD